MSTCSSDRLLSACNTTILNIRMASNGFRPALLFLPSRVSAPPPRFRRESSPTARDDQWLRADRPSPNKASKRLYRVPEIVTRGRFPDGGESDSTWRTQEARHVGSDTIAPGF